LEQLHRNLVFWILGLAVLEELHVWKEKKGTSNTQRVILGKGSRFKSGFFGSNWNSQEKRYTLPFFPTILPETRFTFGAAAQETRFTFGTGASTPTPSTSSTNLFEATTTPAPATDTSNSSGNPIPDLRDMLLTWPI
jgi:hypothetical protein